MSLILFRGPGTFSLYPLATFSPIFMQIYTSLTRMFSNIFFLTSALSYIHCCNFFISTEMTRSWEIKFCVVVCMIDRNICAKFQQNLRWYVTYCQLLSLFHMDLPWTVTSYYEPLQIQNL